MPAEPLDALIRLRRLARDEATGALAAALEAGSRADAAVVAIRRQMADEEALAGRIDTDDLAVEAFGIWLRRARAELQAAELVRERADAETVRARAALVAARAALEAVEAERDRRRVAEREAAQRREQAAPDEAAQHRPKRRRDR